MKWPTSTRPESSPSREQRSAPKGWEATRWCTEWRWKWKTSAEPARREGNPAGQDSVSSRETPTHRASEGARPAERRAGCSAGSCEEGSQAEEEGKAVTTLKSLKKETQRVKAMIAAGSHSHSERLNEFTQEKFNYLASAAEKITE